MDPFHTWKWFCVRVCVWGVGGVHDELTGRQVRCKKRKPQSNNRAAVLL